MIITTPLGLELEGGSDNVSDGDWGISQFFESKLNQQQEDSPMVSEATLSS